MLAPTQARPTPFATEYLRKFRLFRSTWIIFYEHLTVASSAYSFHTFMSSFYGLFYKCSHECMGMARIKVDRFRRCVPRLRFIGLLNSYPGTYETKRFYRPTLCHWRSKKVFISCWEVLCNTNIATLKPH